MDAHKVQPSVLKENIRHWLIERQKMMVAFNELCMLRPFESQPSQELEVCVETFCTELIEYLSYGQFHVFELILTWHQQNIPQCKQRKLLLSKIFSSTIQSIEFHDKYINKSSFESLDRDIKLLGGQLAHRLDTEDELIESVFETILESN